MAKKMFALNLKDDIEVRTLEDLRENFDLEKILSYFKSGELLLWLEDRFYDDEADAIAQIALDDKNAPAKICAALNVECDDDLEFSRRVREKKALLAEMTDDENIIDNAAATALNQEDLAALINMDYKTIYLCGENFNVPIRIGGVKYIGVLSTPKIKIRATSQEDLDAKNISFDNAQLPWQKSLPIEELKALAEKIFQNGGKFPIVKNGKRVSTFDQLDKTERAMALRMVCQGKYTENQIAFMQLTKDLSSGFAFTVDSFCVGGNVKQPLGVVESKILLYKDIAEADDMNGFAIISKEATGISKLARFGKKVPGVYEIKEVEDDNVKLFGHREDRVYEKIVRFLNIAKNF
ncbi:MAG: hypothetical protein IJS69_00710 [Selenomonadaceae bacterium]|nr:hypothetical protein [Selenomonadaceae bacterium]